MAQMVRPLIRIFEEWPAVEPNNTELHLVINWVNQEIKFIKALTSPNKSKFNPAVQLLMKYRDQFSELRRKRLKEKDVVKV